MPYTSKPLSFRPSCRAFQFHKGIHVTPAFQHAEQVCDFADFFVACQGFCVGGGQRSVAHRGEPALLEQLKRLLHGVLDSAVFFLNGP